MSPAFDVVGIGLNATDSLILLDEFPEYAGKVPFKKEIISPGGQVASAIVACARLGLKSKYIGSVGDDFRGEVQLKSLSGTGVDSSSVIVRSGCPNQTAYILIDSRTGERTVLWHRTDELRLRVSDLKEEDLTNCRMLHLDGCDTEAAAWAAGIARRSGIPVSLDVDSIYSNFDPVLRNVDYLVASSTWPGRWTGESDPFKALHTVQREYGMRVASTTLGGDGALALADGQWYYDPAFEVKCMDTTGAGDIFHGAFCFAVLRGMPLQEGLTFANAAAALNCTALGARGHVPVCEEVRHLVKTGKRRASNCEISERVRRENGVA